MTEMFPFKAPTIESEEDFQYAAELGLRYPLDASQLPRLFNLRLAKAKECECERCGDLLDNFHKKTKLLETAHSAETPGLTFWTHVQKEGAPPAHFEAELDKKIRLTPKELTCHDEFIDTLVEVEHNWQRSQGNSTCTSDDTDAFWMRHYNDLKGNIAAQRSLEGESIQELREEAMKSIESHV
jgi:hypothetical protein